MEDLIRKRKPHRMTFTKTVGTLLDELGKQTPDRKSIKVLCVTLERVYNKIKEYDELILNDIKTDIEFEAEHNKIEEYDQKMDLARAKSENFLSNQILPMGSASSLASSPNTKHRMRLPKIELLHFGGDLKDYLGFWSQFQRIHTDSELAAEDKFQYLLQCVVYGSRAREVIESFPPTAENYEKAIDALKSRFGREELLIEYYVRELLSLVVKNATEKRGNLAIAKLYDQLESHLRSLESLGLTSEKYEAILFPLVESCIPEDVMRVWLRNPMQTCEKNESTGSYGSKLKNLLSFMKSEVEGEERLQLARNGFGGGRERWKPKKEESNEEVIPTASALVSSDLSERRSACVFCDKSHESRDCFLAQTWSLDKKKEVLSNKKACYICFKVNHRAKECKSKLKCMVCSKRHQTMMCFELPVNKREEAASERIDSSNALVAKEGSEVLLQTILVNIEANGRRKLVRALIDSGSQNSHLLKRTVAEMGLKPTTKRSLAHSLFGGATTQVKEHGLYKITLKSPNGNFSLDLHVLDQQSICGKIPRLRKGPWDEELYKKNIWIADYGEGSPEIELLIGADFCGQLFTGSQEHLQCGLIACETHLGWLVMGRTTSDCNYPAHSNSSLSITMLTHSERMEHFWDMEVLGIKDPVEKTPREEEVMKYFNDTVSTDIDGRYMVKLPWTDNADLPDNRVLAEKRLLSTTSKLISSGRYTDYESVFQEWERDQIIEVVSNEEPEGRCHYLPHRGVFKEQSTTRVRPVFDAASKEKGKFSLNDCLDKGLNVLDTIPSILMRFRERKIGIISDIRKAFLQISINPEERDFLRFFWWSDYEGRKMKTYRHRRLVFGLNCSPFILGAVINNILHNCSPVYRDVAEVLEKSFYVDNCVTSVDTAEEYSHFVTGATELMQLGQFDLRGWESTTAAAVLEPSHVLGLQWNRHEDVLFCDPDLSNSSCDSFTRRNVLSSLQKVFDPIGFSCPVTIVPKVLLQETWRKNLGWDERLPEEAEEKFIRWLSDLTKLKDIRIPRCVIPLGYRESFSLHTFCDASASSYACVVYLRTEGKEGVNVQLLQAKSRVAPLRKPTIPRLELLACCIGARLAQSMRRAMRLEDVPRFFWTDSTTALHWIKNNENWGVFVNNRVKEIAQLSSREMWKHVPGQKNPADLPSRGCSVQTLKESTWWEGPQWLKGPEEGWPDSEELADEEEVSREKGTPVVAINLSTHETAWYLKRFSKYSTIMRVVAWILRFSANCRNPSCRKVGELSVDEIHLAEQKLLKIVQQESFSDTVIKNKLKGLNAFHDADGLIRVKTKILRREDEELFKCPIVVPSDHPLVERLIYERHLISGHGGTQVVLTDLRQRFWVLRGRKTVQRIVKRCVRCQRYTSKKLETIPAPLPEERVRDALVFEVTGVDLAGPLHLKTGDKTWILLFTCAVYRAIHLELIQSLSTDGFLLGLRRFIARRGRPRKIYSDNGTNFVGAVNQMATLDWNKILQESSILRMQWIFSPPTAAWWGGFWERMVQMVKNILRRVLGRASINFEELSTILCDAEAVINSRPLNYLSEDPEDLTPLTPAMFLQDIQTVGVPDLDNLDSVNLSKRFRYQQNLREDLRKRFREEYLSMLLHQRANKSEIKTIQIGDVVLIGCDKKRLDWPLGRVVELFPGKDNCVTRPGVRVVKVKTACGELIRPVQRLYPLELDCHSGIFDSDMFKHVKDNHFKGKIKDHNSKTGSGEIRGGEHSTDVVKTKCGRTVRKPARYN